MEANTWTLVILGVIVLALLVLILIKNNKDRRDFYEGLNASEDQSLKFDKHSNDID